MTSHSKISTTLVPADETLELRGPAYVIVVPQPAAALWRAIVTSLLVVMNFASAAIAVWVLRDGNSAPPTFIAGGVLVGQVVLLGVWITWSPMPWWLRYPIPLVVGMSGALMLDEDNASLGLATTGIVAVTLAILRPLTGWTLDFRPESTARSGLPTLRGRLDLREIFEVVLAWAVLLGFARLVTGSGSGIINENAWIAIAIVLGAGLALCLPTIGLVFSPWSPALWLWLAASLVAMAGLTVAGTVPDLLRFAWSAPLPCVVTLLLLRMLGFQFHAESRQPALVNSPLWRGAESVATSS